jgi:hypothetical protein
MLLKINDLSHSAFVNIKPIESITYAFYAVRNAASFEMKPPRSKLRGITRKGIVCETPRFLTLFPLQGNLGASSEG